MAYVKQTQELWNKIVNKIDGMFKKRIEHATSWHTHGMSKKEFDEKLWRYVVTPEELELIKQLAPKFFKHRITQISYILVREGMNQGWVYTGDIPGGGEFLPDWFSNSYNRVQIMDPDLVAIGQRRHDAVQKVQAERKEFIEKVEQAYQSAPSVNALIKAWPPIVDLLPPEIMERVNKKTERTKPEDIQLDLGALSTHMLKAKVTA